MPEGRDQGKVLLGGEFYSPVRARLCSDDVLLSELCQPSPRNVPRHEHELAYVSVVLQGDYLEGDRGRLDELCPFTAVFNPAGIAHSTIIGPRGASLFTIEFRSEALRRLGLCLPQHTTFDRAAGGMLWPGLRLYSAFKAQVADGFTVEGLVLDLLAAISAEESRDEPAPRWFGRVREQLHEEFNCSLRMSDLARGAGVHPVHLARVFRKIEKRSPCEYQQGLRVRAACRLLRDPEWSVAAVAAECGFADQSHFTRVFRRVAGATPHRFRQSLAPRVPAVRSKLL